MARVQDKCHLPGVFLENQSTCARLNIRVVVKVQPPEVKNHEKSSYDTKTKSGGKFSYDF